MAGANLARLQQWTTGMDPDDVNEAQAAWSKGAKSLGDVQTALTTAAENMPKGFGEASGVSESAAKAFVTVAGRLSEQKDRMASASVVLTDVHIAMEKARTAAANVPDKPADEAPKAEDFPGVPQVLNLPLAFATAKYNNDVSAYNDADADAEKKITELTVSYDKAIDVMKDIHGDPYVEVPDQDTSDPGDAPGPRPRNPIDPTDHDDDDDQDDDDQDDDDQDDDDQDDDDQDDDDQDDDDQDDDDQDDDDDDDDTDDQDDDDDDTGDDDGTDDGGTKTYPGVIGGGLASAGLLGGPGAINGIRNLLSRGGPTSGVGTIGSSTRAGGPGALGRSGAPGAPGSPVSRGAGGGAGGRGSGGVPGNAGGRGGRGGAGGRGGIGGSGGGKRKRDGDQGRDDELFDDGQDWLDDEGTGPGTLS